MIISTCNQYNKIIGIRAEPWEHGVHCALPALVGWEEPRFQRRCAGGNCVTQDSSHLSSPKGSEGW